MKEDRDLLYKVHVARLKAHGFNADSIERSPWPKTDKEWRQTDHGAPWDTNVIMARWHLKFYYALQRLDMNGWEGEICL